MSITRCGALLLILASAAACGGAKPRTADADAPAATDTATLTGIDRASTRVEPELVDRCRWEDSTQRVAYESDAYGTPYPNGLMERGIVIECDLREGGPRARVVVGGSEGIPMGLQVSFPGTGWATQGLALENDSRAYQGASLVNGMDLNDDGWTDLLAQTYAGTGGQIYDVFMWNPDARRFEQDSVMRSASNVVPVEGRACVHNSTSSGVALRYGWEACWEGGRWKQVRRWTWEDHTPASGRPELAIRTTEELRDGRMVAVRVDTLRETTHAIPPDPPGRR